MTITTTDQSFAPEAAIVVNRFTNVAVTQSVSGDHEGQAAGTVPIATVEAIAYDAIDGTTHRIVTHTFAGQTLPNFQATTPVVLVGRFVDRWFEAVGIYEQSTGAAPRF